MNALLAALRRLPETTNWVAVEDLGRNPEATLFMGMAVTPNDLKALIPLEANLNDLHRFMEKIRKTPAAPSRAGEGDVFI